MIGREYRNPSLDRLLNRDATILSTIYILYITSATTLIRVIFPVGGVNSDAAILWALTGLTLLPVLYTAIRGISAERLLDWPIHITISLFSYSLVMTVPLYEIADRGVVPALPIGFVVHILATLPLVFLTERLFTYILSRHGGDLRRRPLLLGWGIFAASTLITNPALGEATVGGGWLWQTAITAAFVLYIEENRDGFVRWEQR